jgi:hypothetical protein
LKAGDVVYYAEEFNVSWLPTLRALWSPQGQHIMIYTPAQPAQPTRQFGSGAVNYHTGETVVLLGAEFLETRHPLDTDTFSYGLTNTPTLRFPNLWTEDGD